MTYRKISLRKNCVCKKRVIYMINRLRNMVSQVMYAPTTSQTTAIQTNDYNPFANPFVQSSTQRLTTYAVNKPVKGGYFAGYYNGKPNIVGRRLFIEA